RFACTTCGHILNVKSELAGKRGICPKCQARFDIPMESTVERRSRRSKSSSEDLPEPTGSGDATPVPSAAMPGAPVMQAEPTAPAQPIVYAQPAAQPQPVAQPQALAHPQPMAQPQPIVQPQPIAHPQPTINVGANPVPVVASPVPTAPAADPVSE